VGRPSRPKFITIGGARELTASHYFVYYIYGWSCRLAVFPVFYWARAQPTPSARVQYTIYQLTWFWPGMCPLVVTSIYLIPWGVSPKTPNFGEGNGDFQLKLYPHISAQNKQIVRMGLFQGSNLQKYICRWKTTAKFKEQPKISWNYSTTQDRRNFSTDRPVQNRRRGIDYKFTTDVIRFCLWHKHQLAANTNSVLILVSRKCIKHANGER
jgi:hypothetical protein